jgi:hypothetical protein
MHNARHKPRHLQCSPVKVHASSSCRRVHEDFRLMWWQVLCCTAFWWQILLHQASNSLWYNYRVCHSVITLTVANENCCFTLIVVGAYGQENEGSIQQFFFGKIIHFSTLKYFPREENSTFWCKCLILLTVVGDEAVPLITNLLILS